MNRADPLFNFVFAFVISSHALFILLCCLFAFTTPSPNTKSGQKLRVQTINLSEPRATPNVNFIEAIEPLPTLSEPEAKTEVVEPVAEIKNETAPKLELRPQPEVLPQPIETPKIEPTPQPKPVLKSKPKPVAKPQPAPKPVPKPQPKLQPKPAPKPQPKTAPKPEPKPQPKTTVESKPSQDALKQKNEADRQKLLSKANESLKQIKASPHKPLPQKNQLLAVSSQQLEKLQSEVYIANESLFSSAKDGNYRDELIAHLKRSLKLPGYGNVTIELTLLRTGKVKILKILKDENIENRKHIEKIIPTLSFPSFGSSYDNEAQHAFVITLTNDM